MESRERSDRVALNAQICADHRYVVALKYTDVC
jgi:hypothetical protein